MYYFSLYILIFLAAVLDILGFISLKKALVDLSNIKGIFYQSSYYFQKQESQISNLERILKDQLYHLEEQRKEIQELKTLIQIKIKEE